MTSSMASLTERSIMNSWLPPAGLLDDVIRSCVIIFSIGSKYRRFRGLKRLMRDFIAVKSHARPYQ
ncbi:hypothetical protein BRC61_04310 [Halobacteriales archaeon QH_10_65_19]|nr:MAG: hypothetical protein BRC61_04310 [Halobacteriales archaeon QH_10_65_19]